VQDLDITPFQFSEKKGFLYFRRMYFKPQAKWDLVDNHTVEIFNAFIMDARHMPIVSMLKEIFKQVMKGAASKKQWAVSLK